MKKTTMFVALLFFCGIVVIAMPLCSYYYSGINTDISSLDTDFSLSYRGETNSTAGKINVDYTRLFNSLSFGFDVFLESKIYAFALNPSYFSIATGGNFKYFFSPDKPFFGFAGIDGDLSSSNQKIGLNIKTGLGYGRFVDVTPLAKTARIITYLLEKEVIFESPSETEMISLAYEIANLPLTYHNSITELLGVLQEMIGRANIVSDKGIQEDEIQGMKSIIEDKGFVRYCGGDIKLGIGYGLSNSTEENNNFLFVLGFNYAFAATPQIQILTLSSMSSSFGNFFQNPQIKFAIDYDHILSEKVEVISSYCFSRKKSENVLSNLHNISLNLIWTLTEKMRLTLGMRFIYKPNKHKWISEIDLFVGADLL